MGMYDYIKFKTNCPICGELMVDFQSKDGACCLEILEITEVDNFYCSCDKCNVWVEYTRKEGQKDSGKALLEVKKLISDFIASGYNYYISSETFQKFEDFLEAHPLPENTINDFTMSYQTQKERWAKFEEAVAKLPTASPHIFIDPDEDVFIDPDEDEKV